MRSFSPHTVLTLILLITGCASSTAEMTPVRAVSTLSPHPQGDNKAPLLHTRHCLALAIYWEARGEGIKGMNAVGAVVLNRVADPRFPDNACAVVHQGGETPPCQFSWWCDGKSDRPTDHRSWRLALSVADAMSAGPYQDDTRGALYFHTRNTRPPWKYNHTVSIGNHAFYR